MCMGCDADQDRKHAGFDFMSIQNELMQVFDKINERLSALEGVMKLDLIVAEEARRESERKREDYWSNRRENDKAEDLEKRFRGQAAAFESLLKLMEQKGIVTRKGDDYIWPEHQGR